MITVVDYGRGNLFSLGQAIRHLGEDFEISGDAAVVSRATRLLLPGVGAFGDGYAKLKQLGLVEEIRAAAKSGVPILGICLGMQLLATESEEFGRHPGLNLIPGSVRKLPAGDDNDGGARIPNVGWRQLKPTGQAEAAFRSDAMVYFVHSFAFEPLHSEDVIATIDFNGTQAVAAVKRGNIVGYQFHPEKSGEAGLELIRSFLNLPSG